MTEGVIESGMTSPRLRVRLREKRRGRTQRCHRTRIRIHRSRSKFRCQSKTRVVSHRRDLSSKRRWVCQPNPEKKEATQKSAPVLSTPPPSQGIMKIEKARKGEGGRNSHPPTDTDEVGFVPPRLRLEGKHESRKGKAGRAEDLHCDAMPTPGRTTWHKSTVSQSVSNP